MKAAVIHALGQPPTYGDFEDPRPGDGAVVATVAAAALKNLDRGLVSGTHYASAQVQLPSVAGVDGVARLADGRLVYANAIPPYGLMAERTLVDPSRAVELPSDMDPVAAAATPNAAISAWLALEHTAALRPGQHLLVLGATGVTGGIAVQLAKTVFGAGRVVAAGRNAERLLWLRGVGADAVIPLGSGDWRDQVAAEHRAQPFDAVLDYLWGEPAEQVLTALANNSLTAGFHATRFVQVGSMAGPTITLPAGVLRGAGIEIVGFGFGSVPGKLFARANADYLPRLFVMVAKGELHVETQPRPLSEVADAWTHAEPSGTRVVLIP
jgi:NADPH:quinone reductase-like Zn-dependent oxidoreductase